MKKLRKEQNRGFSMADGNDRKTKPENRNINETIDFLKASPFGLGAKIFVRFVLELAY